MVVTIEEEMKNLEYQETMNVEIENIASEKQPSWIPIHEVIENSYFAETKCFPTEFLDQYRNNPNEPQNILNKTKAALKKKAMKNGLYAQVVMIHRRDSENKKEKEKTQEI